MDNQKLNDYIKFVVDKMFDANKYFNDETPWSQKDDIKRVNTIVYVSLEIIRKISILLSPIIPGTAKKALKSLNIDIKSIDFNSLGRHNLLKGGSKLNNQGILFQKIKKND